MARHLRFWLVLPVLEAACPSVSRDLLAVERCASCTLCLFFNPWGLRNREVSCGFALLVTLRPNFDMPLS